MERLTFVTENGEVLFHPGDLPEDRGMTITQLAQDGRYKALEEIAERLANREQAEEQGLLLRLPCKVGDKVYTACSWGIESGVVGSIEIISDRIFVNNQHGAMIGEAHNIFLTQEEAEAALQKMKGEET